MTDVEIAVLYRRYFLCFARALHPLKRYKAMKRFAAANPDVTYQTRVMQKHVRYTLLYNQEEIYSEEV